MAYGGAEGCFQKLSAGCGSGTDRLQTWGARVPVSPDALVLGPRGPVSPAPAGQLCNSQ